MAVTKKEIEKRMLIKKTINTMTKQIRRSRRGLRHSTT